MNYLTNHYRHKAEVLQQKINLLENKMREAGLGSMGAAGLADSDSQFSVGGSSGEETFSGAYLGQLLASGNMQAVRNYLAQFYGNNPSALAAITSSLGIQNAGPADAAAGAGFGSQFGKPMMNDVGPGMPTMGVADMAGGPASQQFPGGPFSGQQLGQYLGSGNADLANQYVSQFGPNGAYNAGPANLRSRGGRRARVAGMAESVNYFGNKLFEEAEEPEQRNNPQAYARARYGYGPYTASNSEAYRNNPHWMVQAAPAPGVQSAARQGEVDAPGGSATPPFDGAYLGQLLGRGNMDAVKAYIEQYYVPRDSFARVSSGRGRASQGRPAGSAGGGGRPRPVRRPPTSGGGFGT